MRPFLGRFFHPQAIPVAILIGVLPSHADGYLSVVLVDVEIVHRRPLIRPQWIEEGRCGADYHQAFAVYRQLLWQVPECRHERMAILMEVLGADHELAQTVLLTRLVLRVHVRSHLTQSRALIISRLLETAGVGGRHRPRPGLPTRHLHRLFDQFGVQFGVLVPWIAIVHIYSRFKQSSLSGSSAA